MKSFFIKIISTLCALIFSIQVNANSSTPLAVDQRIKESLITLNTLSQKAEQQGIDVSREKMTLALASLFTRWIMWDEDNVKKNSQYYFDHPVYKKNALALAKSLASNLSSANW